MRSNTTRLWALVIAAVIVLSMLPVMALATDPEAVAEGTATFANDTAAFDGESVSFTAETGGDMTVEITAATPGWYVDVYENDEWIVDFCGIAADSVTFAVKPGASYEILICSYTVYNENLKFATAGSVSYAVSFLSNGETADTEEPTEPTDPADIPGSSQDNPKTITGFDWTFIDAGQTIWYVYDNYQNMMENGVYSMMLRVNSTADYTVLYRGAEVPIDENGFVNYEMVDMTMQGKYMFCVTNNSSEKLFFGIEVAERPQYVNNGDVLVLGNNAITLDPSAIFTLYEFCPTKTGVYKITAAEGVVGNWGTSFNPVDNTAEKTDTLVWTCSSVGQHIMVGFTGAETTTATVVRTGDYVPPVEIPWVIYENTYDFSYTLPDGEVVDIDLTDGNTHTAVLGSDGFYHYGSEKGDLMVANLKTAEINIQDAYNHGGLRAWLRDEGGNTIIKTNYNDAMIAYYNAGLVPVTEELATMIQQVGQANGWWVSNGLVFTGKAPEDTGNAWMQLCAYLDVPSTGVTVSGKVDGVSDEEGWIELWLGEELVDMVDVIDGTYSFEEVAAGSYTVIANGLSHVERAYALEVADEDVTLDMQICLFADVNGDGSVDIGDVGRLYSHVRETNLITDEYLLSCCDTNGDGDISIGDVGFLYKQVAADTIG